MKISINTMDRNVNNHEVMGNLIAPAFKDVDIMSVKLSLFSTSIISYSLKNRIPR